MIDGCFSEAGDKKAMQDKRKLFIPSLFLGALLWSASVGAESPTDGKNPFAGNPEAITAGKAVFEGVCAGYCHATEKSMRPGRCPNLFDCEWKHGSSDGQIFHSLSDGVPKTEMGASLKLRRH
jgi:cytochrome c2